MKLGYILTLFPRGSLSVPAGPGNKGLMIEANLTSNGSSQHECGLHTRHQIPFEGDIFPNPWNKRS